MATVARFARPLPDPPRRGREPLRIASLPTKAFVAACELPLRTGADRFAFEILRALGCVP
jgi:hypothetical protein